LVNLAELLARIPDQYKPIVALGIGSFMLVSIALFHGAGLHRILVYQKRGERRLRVGRPHPAAAFLLFGGTVFCMLALHVMEVLIWSFVLTHMGVILRGYDAIYFTANTYTTLGYGNGDVVREWRNITPVIAISGLFTFAWTTSSLVAVVAVHRQLIDQLEEERVQEMHLRFGLRKSELDVLKSATASERLEKANGRQASETGLFRRLRIWQTEKKREGELLTSVVAEIKEIRRKERRDEEKLGQDAPPQKSGIKK
jgi:uncharacterized small protein (DUF1192 family)